MDPDRGDQPAVMLDDAYVTFSPGSVATGTAIAGAKP
jgi:hypothetical protein